MAALGASHSLSAPASRPRSPWRRLGFAGFLFFLIKGLLWLIVPAIVWFGS